MSNMDFKTYITSVGNDLKISIDDLINAIVIMQEDIEKLKSQAPKPNS